MRINLKPIFFLNVVSSGAKYLYFLPDIYIGLFGIYFTYFVGHDGRVLNITVFGKSIYFKFKWKRRLFK